VTLIIPAGVLTAIYELIRYKEDIGITGSLYYEGSWYVMLNMLV
jgi:hypothetical protein